MKKIRLMTGIFTVSFWTMMSRILGFVRDILINTLIGPGMVMDAYIVAFRLPNMFRRLFAEGAFNSAFVPLFSKKLEGEENAEEFAAMALSWLGVILLILSALAMIFMPALVWITAKGLSGGDGFDLATEFGRITFPYILFISLAALFSGVLNASGRFAAAAAAPVFLNIILVGTMTFANSTGADVARALIWAIPAAGVAQLVLVWVAARRAGFHISFVRPRLTGEMGHLLRVAIPAALAGGVLQINLIVGQVISTGYESATSWLYTADRLYQLPLGVIGIAVGIVLLPDLSRRLKAGDDAGGRDAFSRAGEVSLLLTIPCAIALIVVPLPLVSVLFQRGEFGADDSAATALAVAVYGLGLPAFVLQKLLQPLFFAREDTKSPFRYALWTMGLNAVLAFGLAPLIGWLSPAVAASVAAWGMVAMLARGARGFGSVARFDARFWQRIWRIVLSAVMMGVVLWGVNLILSPLLGTPWWRILALVSLIGVGTIAYFAIGQFFGAFKISELRSALRRR